MFKKDLVKKAETLEMQGELLHLRVAFIRSGEAGWGVPWTGPHHHPLVSSQIEVVTLCFVDSLVGWDGSGCPAEEIHFCRLR